jgi:hypothetical protein
LDPVGFARQRLGFEPDELQAQVLQSRSKRLLLNCSRQWGKSSVCAIAALYRPGSLVVVTGPSGRQAGEFVDKVREFASRLDIKPRGDGRNKSWIVAVPPNEKTVRGFSGASMLKHHNSPPAAADTGRIARYNSSRACAASSKISIGRRKPTF